MPPKRKRREEEELSSPAWMATFSDLATLLLAFFVLLYSFSIIDIKKFETFVASFRGVGLLDAGVTPVKKNDTDRQSDDPSNKRKEEDLDNFLDQEMREELAQKVIDPAELDEDLLEVYKIIKTYLQENNLEGEVTLRYETRGIVLEIKDKVFFDSGKSEIKSESKAFLDRLGDLFSEIPNQISIEGHTDSVPTNPRAYETNWELSVDRAAKVVRYFTERQGIPANRLSATGYGEWRPIADNKSLHFRSLNRRVAIIILAKDQYESRVILGGNK